MQRLSYKIAANYMEMYTIKQINDLAKRNINIWESDDSSSYVEVYTKYITKYAGEHAIYIYKLKAKEDKVADAISKIGEDGLYFGVNGKKDSFIAFVPKGTCITLGESAKESERRYKLANSMLNNGVVYWKLNKINMTIIADGKVYDPLKIYSTVKEGDRKIQTIVSEYLFGVKSMQVTKSKWKLPNIITKEDEDDALHDATQMAGTLEYDERLI